MRRRYVKPALGLMVLVCTIFVIAFLLHFVWEMLQIPFYDDMMTAEHKVAVLFCAKATLGDALIAVLCYLAVAMLTRDAQWILGNLVWPFLLYIALGILVTVFLEYLATEVLDRWQYGLNMPRIPVLGTGVLPLMQWMILPVFNIFCAKIFYLGLLYSEQDSK